MDPDTLVHCGLSPNRDTPRGVFGVPQAIRVNHVFTTVGLRPITTHPERGSYAVAEMGVDIGRQCRCIVFRGFQWLRIGKPWELPVR